MATRHTDTRPAGPSEPVVRPGYYRGIKLQKPAVPPTRPLAEIRRAVKLALEKNAALLAQS